MKNPTLEQAFREFGFAKVLKQWEGSVLNWNKRPWRQYQTGTAARPISDFVVLVCDTQKSHSWAACRYNSIFMNSLDGLFFSIANRSGIDSLQGSSLALRLHSPRHANPLTQEIANNLEGAFQVARRVVKIFVPGDVCHSSIYGGLRRSRKLHSSPPTSTAPAPAAAAGHCCDRNSQ